MAKKKSQTRKEKQSRQDKTKKQKPDKAFVSQITPARKRLFTILMVALPFVVLLLLEAVLQLFSYGGNTKLFITLPHKESPFYGINTEVGKRYFYQENFVPSPRKDLFLKTKPDSCYRIFVLGGSTTAGYPYGNNLTFTRILNRRLSDIFPEKHIEVVNTAMTAINSFTQLDFMDEILEQKPDAILIYSGHNEFYGALGPASVESVGGSYWLAKTYLAAQKFKTVILLRNTIGDIKGLLAKMMGTQSDVSASMMARIVGNKEILYQSPIFQAGISQFRNNLTAIIEKAQKANCHVVLSELVSNIHDNAPFVSLANKDLPSADEVFRMARSLEAEGKYDSARAAYYRAKDLDALRFRAPEALNAVVHELAEQYELPVVPMKSYFESVSPHGLIGNNLMHEHLHPKKQGYFLMADAFFETLKENKFLANTWPEDNIKTTKYYETNWGFTELDTRHAALGIAYLKNGWPFKKSKAANDFFLRYRPRSLQDSLAFEVLKDNVTLEQAHIQLADYFERSGNLQRAWLEHKALIYTVPYIEVFYEDAVEVLIRMNRFDDAIALLEDGLRYSENKVLLTWLGRIHLMTSQNERGIGYLEKALQLDPNNVEIQFFACAGYYSTLQLEKANQLYNSLLINRNAQNMTVLKNYKQASEQANQYLLQAEESLKQNNFPAAMIALSNSLKRLSTAKANQLMGHLLLRTGGAQAAIPYLETAYKKRVGKKTELLYDLGKAYVENQQYNEAMDVIRELKANSSDYAKVYELTRKVETAMSNNSN